ncbi:MAG: ribosome assembly cofactor RimP [Synechococcaceae cyanobacterium ELA182]
MPQSIPESIQQGVTSETAAGFQASPDSGCLADASRQSGAPRSPEAVPTDLDAALQNLANGVASDLGLAVKAIRLLSHRLPLTVQVLVQRADGLDVSLDECARFSGPLGEALETSGLLSLAYVLEVSSPGIGEVLASDRDFTSFRGFPVEVLHHAEGSAEQVRQGLLLGRDERMVLLNMRGRTVRIPREEVLVVRLICPTDDS